MSDTHHSPDNRDNGVPPSRPPTGTRPVASLSVESLCNLLADARVRAILRAFEQASEATLDQSTVVEELASESPHAREDVSLQLRHIVLPKLTDVGVLDHTVERMRIQYRPEPRLTSLLVHAREDPKPVQNRLFGVLGYPQRRTILSELVDDETRALTSLTLDLMRNNEDQVTLGQSAQEFQRARTVLVHKHLPRLVASDLVTYRTESEMVALMATSAARRLPEYLATLDAVEIG